MQIYTFLINFAIEQQRKWHAAFKIYRLCAFPKDAKFIYRDCFPDFNQRFAGLRTLWLGIASVVAGTAAAVAHGNLQPFPALACLLFAIFAQCASNVMHRYYDAKNGYGENEENNIVYADDIDRPLTYILKEGIQVFSILTATAGLAVLSMAGWWTILFAAFIAIIVVISNTDLILCAALCFIRWRHS